MSNPELNREYLATSAQAYGGFLSGVAVLHSPMETIKIHNRDPENALEVVGSANYLIVEGLRAFLSSTTDQVEAEKGKSGGKLQHYEERYRDLVPYMISAVEEVETQNVPEVIDGLVLPKPFLDEQLYKYLCHGRWSKLNLERLVFPVIPDMSLAIHARQPLQAIRQQSKELKAV